MCRCIALFLSLQAVWAATPKTVAAGRREVARTCTRCHTLDVVEAQRLSRDEWTDELRKMTRMGAKLRDREAVLDYLTDRFGEVPAPSATTAQ